YDRALVDVGAVPARRSSDLGLVLGHAGRVIGRDRGVVDAVDGDGDAGGVAERALGVRGLVAEAVGDRSALGEMLDAGGVERVGGSAAGAHVLRAGSARAGRD